MWDQAKEVWTDTNRLLRYVLSGFVVLAVAWAVDRPHTVLVHMEATAGSPWPILLLAPVFGVVLYSIHSVLCFPGYGFLAYWWGSSHDWSARGKARSEHVELFGKRWKARFGKDDDARAHELMFRAWTSQIHFLYCSAWALIVTPIVLGCVGRDVLLLIPIGGGVALFLLTFLDDYRAARLIRTLYFPCAVPTTRPVVTVDRSQPYRHTIDFVDETTPTSTANPTGVRGAQIWVKVGDPTELTFLGTVTHTPYVAQYTDTDANKVAHYMLRWESIHGEPGPWSETASATIGV